MIGANDCMVHVCCSGVHSSFMMGANDCMVHVCCSGVHSSCTCGQQPAQGHEELHWWHRPEAASSEQCWVSLIQQCSTARTVMDIYLNAWGKPAFCAFCILLIHQMHSCIALSPLKHFFLYPINNGVHFIWISFLFCVLVISSLNWHIYWAVQAGLTPLTFAQHRLSPLAAFTSGVYFLHSERRWQWICKFYTANFKDIFEGP